MTISEKIAYLQGMADGMNLEAEDSKEAKLLKVVIDVLEEIGYSIEDLEDEVELLSEGLDVVSEDLEEVEEFLFDDEDYDDDEDFDDEYDEDEDFFEVACPNCEEDLVIDADVLDAGFIQCPNCGDKFAIDLSDEECGCDCGCCEEE